jgi:hypothetical protein
LYSSLSFVLSFVLPSVLSFVLYLLLSFFSFLLFLPLSRAACWHYDFRVGTIRLCISSVPSDFVFCPYYQTLFLFVLSDFVFCPYYQTLSFVDGCLVSFLLSCLFSVVLCLLLYPVICPGSILRHYNECLQTLSRFDYS